MSYTVATPPSYADPRRYRRRRPFRRLLALLILVILCALGVAIWTALPALAAAQDARNQINAIHDLGNQVRQTPTAPLVVALDAHDTRLITDVQVVQNAWNVWQGPALLVSGIAPRIHNQLAQVQPLLTYGDRLARAGHLLSGALLPLLRAQQGHPLPGSGSALVGNLAAARPSLRRAAALLRSAQQARAQLVPASLPAAIQAGLGTLDPLLPQAPSALNALAALPAAAGADGPRDYLVVPENSEDLRAGGGFIGTVGILHLDHGRSALTNLVDASVYDAYRGRGADVPAPLPLARHHWGPWYLRDANWSADFPTTARLLETFYALDTGRHVDGVIAFDSWLLPSLLQITGPVPVPGYPDVLTPTNGFQRIDYYVNVVGHGNKAFALAAYKAVFARLRDLRNASLRAALAAMKGGIGAHDLVLYANDADAEKAIRLAGADGAINPTTGDYLYVVDQNTSLNKVNQMIQEAITYQAVIQPDRSILATATLQYTNTADTYNLPPANGSPFYSDFVRVYVPAGSALLSATGLDETWPTYTVHGKTQLAGYFGLRSHQTRTVTFRYRVPANVDPGARYTLLVQKQVGTLALPLRIAVSAAPGIGLEGGPSQEATTLGSDVTLAVPVTGGAPRLHSLPTGPAEQPVVPGGHPEPWITVPSRIVATR